MSDQILTPLAALGDHLPRVEKIGSLTIEENPDLAMTSIAVRHGRDRDLQTLLIPALGGELPSPGRSVFTGDVSAIWTGVGQWFLIASYAAHPDFAREIKSLVKDTASVTEQTDGWVVFDITGNNLIPLLERLCNVNGKAMMAGDATRCLIEHLGCLIICHESFRKFTILGPRSSAASLHHSLVKVAHNVA